MAHILVGGDLRSGAPVRSRLTGWGMTAGAWNAGEGYPTVQECDAVIVVWSGPEEVDSLQAALADALSARKPDEAPPAPLLLLGDFPGSLLLTREAQRVVPMAGPEGVDLKMALEGCLNEARRRRVALQGSRQQGDPQGYLQFLGHELRSPLTAAKTALEVLQGELGGLMTGAGAPEDARLKMLDIALRNIQRLHRTVDWSQDLLELERSLPAGQWQDVPLDQVLRELPPASRRQCGDELAEQSLFTDPNLLQVLVGQALRVLEYALPDVPLDCRLRTPDEEAAGLQLWLVPEAGAEDLSCPRIARTGLGGSADRGQEGIQEELARLSEYVISRPLLVRLQVKVLVRDDAAGRPGLVLEFPPAACRPDPTADESHLSHAV